MTFQYPDSTDNGKHVEDFIRNGWHGPIISAQRFADGCAMAVKLKGQQVEHRVACAIIYDDHVYFGKSNHGLETLPAQLVAAMRSRSLENHGVSNCAEIEAMVAVVDAGYNPQCMGMGLKVHACRTDTGKPVAPCSNCNNLFLGAECTSRE